MEILYVGGCPYEDNEGEVLNLQVRLEEGEILTEGGNIEIEMMKETENIDYDLGEWHLSFVQDRRIVIINDNGTDESLSCKFVPAEISYDSLKELINSDDKQDTEFYIKYL